MRTGVLVGAVTAATLAIAGCSANGTADSAKAPTTGQVTPSPEPSVGSRITVGGLSAVYHGTADVSGNKDVTIHMGNGFFDPTVIRGKPGQQLVIHLENTGQDGHTFTIADDSADITVQPRSVAEGKVTLPKSGNLAFFCQVEKDKGMVGVFTVSGALDAPGPTAGVPHAS
jgi:plastocyanin